MISTSEPAGIVPLLEGVPLFADLSPAELIELAWIVSPFACAPGERLFRQGDPGDAMYCVGRGSLGLSVRAPGGGELSIGTVGPGEVVGEMALLDAGPRSATATATEPTWGWALPAVGFGAFRAALRPSGFKILRRLAALLAARLQAYAGDAAGGDPVRIDDGDRLGGERLAASDLDRANLALFPTFRDFSPAELDEILARASVRTLPRGRVVFGQGDDAGSCFVILRGAVMVCVERDRVQRKLAVEGPGGMVGHLALIAPSTRSATCVTRASTTLLEIDRPAFDALFESNSPAAYKFFAAMTEWLSEELRRVNQRMGGSPAPAVAHNCRQLPKSMVDS